MSNRSKHARPDVLVVPEDSVVNLYSQSRFYSGQDVVEGVLDAIESRGRFAPRDWAESTERVKQIVAYGLIRNGRKVLCLRRARTSNRKALRLRYTVLVGGHVDSVELNDANPVAACLVRELDEELGLVPTGPITVLGVVVDVSTRVGRLHLGLIYDVPIDSDSLVVSPHMDNGEFANAAKKIRYPLRDYRHLARLSRRFDPWSSLTLSSPSVKRLFGTDLPFEYQQGLPFFDR